MTRAKRQATAKKTNKAALDVFANDIKVQDSAIVFSSAGKVCGPRCGSREDTRRATASNGGIFMPAQNAHGADSNGKPCREGASPAVSLCTVLPHSARRPASVEGGETSDNPTQGTAMNANHDRSVSAFTPDTNTSTANTETAAEILARLKDRKPATVAEAFSPAALSSDGSRIARIIAAFEGSQEVVGGGSRADIIQNECQSLDVSCISLLRILATAQMEAEADTFTEPYNGLGDALHLIADVMQFRLDIANAAFNLQPKSSLR